MAYRPLAALGPWLIALCLGAPRLVAGDLDPATSQILIDGVTAASAMVL